MPAEATGQHVTKWNQVFFCSAVTKTGGSSWLNHIPAAKCKIFHKYNHFSLIFAICNSCFSKTWRYTLWCAALTMWELHALEMKLWAFSIPSATRNDVSCRIFLQQPLEAFPITLLPAAGWPKIWPRGPQDERWPISINNLFDMHNTAVWYKDSWTALSKEDSLILCRIESV